jgi:hypothetical protein
MRVRSGVRLGGQFTLWRSNILSNYSMGNLAACAGYGPNLSPGSLSLPGYSPGTMPTVGFSASLQQHTACNKVFLAPTWDDVSQSKTPQLRVSRTLVRTMTRLQRLQ